MTMRRGVEMHCPAFLHGMASVIHLSGSVPSGLTSRGDSEAIRQDFQRVGGDLLKAVTEVGRTLPKPEDPQLRLPLDA